MANGTAPPIEEISGFNMAQDGGDPIEIVLNFCDHVPTMLEFIFLNPGFGELVDASFEETNVSYTLFSNSLAEAGEVLSINVEEIRARLRGDGPQNENTDPNAYRQQFLGQLQRIGFTGNSLELKANLLNRRLRQLFQTMQKLGKDIVDFAIKPLVKLIRALLKFLNKLFESLKIVIPGLDAIKEIKDVGEEYLDVADEMEDE
jgi:hypothetical protein